MFILLQMLAQSGEKWEWLRYLTPLTAFDSAALASGGGSLWPALGWPVGRRFSMLPWDLGVYSP